MSRRLPTSQVTPYALAAIITGLGNLALTPLWVASFGLAAYGEYAVTWALAIAGGSACAGWIRTAAMRHAGAAGSIRELPLWAVGTSIAVAASATAGLARLAGVLGGVEVLAAGALAATVVTSTLVSTGLQRNDRAWRYSLSEAVKIAVTVISTYLLAWGTGWSSSVVLVLGLAIGHLATTGLVAEALRPGRGDATLLREWWRYGWPLSIYSALTPILLFADRIVLQLFADPVVVGAFAALSDVLIRGMAAVSAPVVTVAWTWAMRQHNSGQDRVVRQEMRRLARLFLLATVLCALVVTALHSLISGVLGIGTLPLACFAFLTLAGGGWQAATFVHKPLELDGRTVGLLGLLLAAIAVEFVVCLLLVPPYGPSGAAAGLLAGVSAYVLATQGTVHWYDRRRSQTGDPVWTLGRSGESS